MATKTITIKKEAYELLAKDKREDESFSDEIIRWSNKKKHNLRRFAGMWSDWSDKDINDLKDSIRDMRKTGFKSRFKELGI
ncbi:MAG: antitoxin VapB family protein [Candidatus Woesearchaeota archaeon]